MAARPLQPHATTPAPDIDALHVQPQCTVDGLLACRYVVEGDVDALQVPPLRPARHTDGLWRSTCFEAFFRTPGAHDYVEVNASPSTEWATYAFDDYRAGMRVVTPDPAPDVRCHRADGALVVDLTVRLDALGVPTGGPLELGFAAVLQHRTGALSYWALAHPDPRPDFHHPGSFVLTLPPPDNAASPGAG